MIVKLGMLIVFFGVMVGIGLYCRRHATDVNGFVLGGRSVGPWLTAFAYGTSYFSAVVFVGYAGQFGWKYGIAATWAGIGNALLGSLLAWAVLGRRTRIMTQHLSSATMPEFFGKRFGSDKLKIAASVIIFIFLIPYTASLYNGLSRLFGMAFNIDYSVCVIVMAVLTGVYVIAGGYMATAINDFIQGIIMIVGICAVIAAVLNSQGGFMAALEGLAQVSDPAVSDIPGVFASFFGPDPLNLLGVVLLTSLGTWGLPQMVQKFYAIRDEKAIETGTVISSVFALLVARLLRSTIIKGEATPFVMELPPYRLPTLFSVLMHCWERTWMYVKKAGTVILAISIIIWAGLTYPKLDEAESAKFDTQIEQLTSQMEALPVEDEGRAALEEQITKLEEEKGAAELAYSYAGRLGKAIEPLTLPAGFEWRTDIALLAGVAAKEAVVSTMGTAYSLGDVDPEDAQSLGQLLQSNPNWNKATALSLMLFVLLYSPCFVSLVVIQREAGGWRWLIFSMVFNTLLAFAVSVAAYQIGLVVWD